MTDSELVNKVISRVKDRIKALRPEDQQKISRGISTHDSIALSHLQAALQHLDRP